MVHDDTYAFGLVHMLNESSRRPRGVFRRRKEKIRMHLFIIIILLFFPSHGRTKIFGVQGARGTAEAKEGGKEFIGSVFYLSCSIVQHTTYQPDA